MSLGDLMCRQGDMRGQTGAILCRNPERLYLARSLTHAPPMVRRLLGMGVIAVSLAACSHADVGYKGPRLEGTVRVWAVPMDSCGPITAERPMVCRSTFVKNFTDQLLVVSCSLEALDSNLLSMYGMRNFSAYCLLFAQKRLVDRSYVLLRGIFSLVQGYSPLGMDLARTVCP